MSRHLDTTNRSRTGIRMISRERWSAEAYDDKFSYPTIKNFHFAERMHYGAVDSINNSVIPNEDFIRQDSSGRLFDFVMESYKAAKLNCIAASNSGIVDSESFVGKFDMVSSYSNPKVKHGRYLDGIFQFYNETHIPTRVGNTSITSYEGYVKHFFDFFFNFNDIINLSLTSWNTSNRSSILDTGLAFSIFDLPYDADSRKVNEIIRNPNFEYFRSLCLNYGFSISDNNPNILVYDLESPAGKTIRNSYSLFSLSNIFSERYINTYTLDNDIIYNKINIYYNKYAQKNSLIRQPMVKNCKTVSKYHQLIPVPLSQRPFSDEQEIWQYIKIRNREEGSPFSPQKLKEIYKKAKYFYKTLDKPSAISYTNDMFRDQLWNKNNGFHDLKAKIEGKANLQSQRRQGGGSMGRGGSSY